MPFSHHSHSGQFCAHASNTLEEMIRKAISLKMQMFALTEHTPRDRPEDLYPEEIAAGITCTELFRTFDAYIDEAVRLQSLYSDQIEILIGMEIDWIRPASLQLIETLMEKHRLDLFVGSVHHVHGIPIDYDTALYARACKMSGGSERQLFIDYYEAQYKMLQALRPPVVGHMDLIRLKSSKPDHDWRCDEEVWAAIGRNLRYVIQYGGVLEINGAALRKGLREPYPRKEICELFQRMGGRFVLSDDSHGVDQVGACYDRVLEFLEGCGVEEVVAFGKGGRDNKLTGSNEDKGVKLRDKRFPGIVLRTVSVQNISDFGLC